MWPGKNDVRRFREEKIFKGIMRFCALLLVVLLLSIVVTVAVKGLPALSLSMLINTPKGDFYLGGEGGILNAILGSLYVACGATLIAFAVSLPIVLYINAYKNKKSRLSGIIRFSLDVLWGIPSIVYGAFGFTLMIFFGLKTSLLAGILVIALVEIPILARAADEAAQVVPPELKLAALSLGATNGEAAWKVIFRQIFPGVLTALLLAFGRGIGDAAAVLFTAGFSDYIPTSLNQQAATLPLAIFFQLGSTSPEVQKRAYAAALVLTLLVLLVSLTARFFARKLTRYKIDRL